MNRGWMLAMPLVLVGNSGLSIAHGHSAASRQPKEQIVNEITPSTLTVTNPCNGDVVVLAGETHTIVHVTQAKSGNYSAAVSVSTHYSGIGAPSGAQYQASEKFHDQFLVANPLPYEETIQQDLRLRSQGSSDNYTARVQFHFTINANGVFGADVQNVSNRCEG